MNIIKQDIGVWVKASEELPQSGNGRKQYRVRDIQQVEWSMYGITSKRWEDVYEWLKPIEQVYTLTEIEIKIMLEQFKTEILHSENPLAPNVEEFFQSITTIK